MVQIPQTCLILGKKNNMPCLTILDVPAGTKGHHGRVDGLQCVNVMLLFQLFHQICHNQAAGHGIVRSTVMGKVRKTQGIRHDIQLELVQVAQKMLRKDQGIHRSIGLIIAKATAFCPDKSGIKI